MRRTHVFASCLLLALLLIGAAQPSLTNAAEINVGNGGTYNTVAQAIDAAHPGDIIVLGPGTYNENLVVNKPLTIVGNGSATTIIQAADPSKDVLQLKSNNIRVEGLTVQGASGAAGVNVDQVASCVVAGISAHGNVRGVYLNHATNNEVRNSNLADNGYGVYGDYASSNTISNNVATGEKGYGNTLGDGIYLFYSDSNTITENDLSGNHVYGISLYHSSNNTISTNTISKNEQIGVRLRECDNNTLKFNTISGNAQQGILIIETTGNQIYLNSFI
ncbi:MAG: right-handed parallel beta-helix repeat-containing protein, partial [Halobacteriota archaeon]